MTTDTLSQPNATIDVSGLSPDAVRVVESLVGLLRTRSGPVSPNQIDPEKWSADFLAWTASHPKRDITIDDDRDSIYAGCGE